MKCIDAVEGTVKSILNSMHNACVEEGVDDSEYVRNVKAVLGGTKQFIMKNPEVVEDPELLDQVLYTYSRNLWLTGSPVAAQGQPAKPEEADEEGKEYQTYYYDYLYQRDTYPR